MGLSLCTLELFYIHYCHEMRSPGPELYKMEEEPLLITKVSTSDSTADSSPLRLLRIYSFTSAVISPLALSSASPSSLPLFLLQRYTLQPFPSQKDATPAGEVHGCRPLWLKGTVNPSRGKHTAVSHSFTLQLQPPKHRQIRVTAPRVTLASPSES